MKFGKELQSIAVPEWRTKYLDYKAGKKHVRTTARALGRASTARWSIGQWIANYNTIETFRTTLDGCMVVRGVSNPGELPIQSSQQHVPFVPRPEPIASASTHGTTPRNHPSHPLGTLSAGFRNPDLVRKKEEEFYGFLATEIHKVESFYAVKETEAGRRLAVLIDQFCQMNNQHDRETTERLRQRQPAQQGGPCFQDGDSNYGRGISPQRFQDIKAKPSGLGRRFGAFAGTFRAPLAANTGDACSYDMARRKLKLALQQFYRDLELLKSYATQNHTAFRKLEKKFDKVTHARLPYRFMTARVETAQFVNSDALQGYIDTVEDLYAQHFLSGCRKLAASTLRRLDIVVSNQSGSSFLNGFLMGTGAVFASQGLASGVRTLFDEDPRVRTQTKYLMQLYGGYLLMLLLFYMFCINCSVWTRTKVNHAFIFEFDQNNRVDWRQLSEFPSFFLLMLGISMWANFSRYGPDELYLYYPVGLIGVTTITIALPLPVLSYSSRKAFLYAHWRLLCSGIYPVEFLDTFLADNYCSLAYALANIEVLFCLYANRWSDPHQCDSHHSRALGFLTALPSLWRFFQCLRRYRDTRRVFPHLACAGKYTMSIMAATTLSMYRIESTQTNLALFTLFAFLSSVYASAWDLVQDFSLLQRDSRYHGLRDTLALKSLWPYYFVAVIDPTLRMTWILYVVFTHKTQHSTILSFAISLVEVMRRGIWSFFRVEKEHCANVSDNRAWREVPLPYRIVTSSMDHASIESSIFIRPHSRREFTRQRPEVLENAEDTVSRSDWSEKKPQDTVPLHQNPGMGHGGRKHGAVNEIGKC